MVRARNPAPKRRPASWPADVDGLPAFGAPGPPADGPVVAGSTEGVDSSPAEDPRVPPADGSLGSRSRPSGVPRTKAERRRLKPVEREIRKLQANHRYLSFSRVGFARLVRDIQSQFSTEPLRWSAEALLLFQSAAEEYLMYLYADAYLATHHRHCVTLQTEDLRLVRRLRQPHCWGEPI
uniref:Core Histone H2A/H2B/H3 domain-containing protein n=1 Tax=Noctiluca scintillans TaxID=2966 RepID=A0A7S0ZZA5_NOCSC|mmetsp:Transcript_24824/g.65194  ORF Transcript_24824/g.65194 Transcript_24824/m.65194 type:complete len:180 (+) Transcript_24824:64-603(+)